MIRRLLAGVCLSVGLLAAATSYTAWQAHRLITDPEPLADATDAVLDAEPVRDELADRITSAVFAQVLGASPDAVADATGIDVEPRVAAVARSTLDDPGFRDALGDAMVDLHQILLSDDPGPLVLDVAEMTAAFRRTAERDDPQLAALLPPGDLLTVGVPIDDFPDLSAAPDGLERVLSVSLPAMLIGVSGAFALHPRRPVVLRSLGIWAVAVGTGHILVARLFPTVTRWFVDDPDGFAEPVAGTLGRFLQPPAIVLAAAGVAAIAASFAWSAGARTRRDRPRTASAAVGRPTRAPSPVVATPPAPAHPIPVAAWVPPPPVHPARLRPDQPTPRVAPPPPAADDGRPWVRTAEIPVVGAADPTREPEGIPLPRPGATVFED